MSGEFAKAAFNTSTVVPPCVKLASTSLGAVSQFGFPAVFSLRSPVELTPAARVDAPCDTVVI